MGESENEMMIERDGEKFEVDLLFSLSQLLIFEVFFFYDEKYLANLHLFMSFLFLLHSFLEILSHVTKLDTTPTSARGLQQLVDFFLYMKLNSFEFIKNFG